MWINNDKYGRSVWPAPKKSTLPGHPLSQLAPSSKAPQTPRCGRQSPGTSCDPKKSIIKRNNIIKH